MDFNSIYDLDAYAALGGFRSVYERQAAQASQRYKNDDAFRAVVDARIGQTEDSLLPNVTISSEDSTVSMNTGQDGDWTAVTVSHEEGLAALAEFQKLRPDQSGTYNGGKGMGVKIMLDGRDISAAEAGLAARRQQYVQSTLLKHQQIFSREATAEEMQQVEAIARREIPE